jgi:hypothetical protein
LHDEMGVVCEGMSDKGHRALSVENYLVRLWAWKPRTWWK